MLDRRMVKLLIIVHPAVKIPLRPCLAVSIAAPVVIPMAVFPLGKLPGHKGARRSRIMPKRKAVSSFKGGSFQNHISLYCLQEIPPFCASANMTRSAGCYEIRGQTGEDVIRYSHPGNTLKKARNVKPLEAANRNSRPAFSPAFSSCVPRLFRRFPSACSVGTVGLTPLGKNAFPQTAQAAAPGRCLPLSATLEAPG